MNWSSAKMQRRLWAVGAVALAVVVFGDLFLNQFERFDEGLLSPHSLPSFYPFYSTVAIVLAVAAGWVLALILKREEGYYGDD